MGCISNYLGEVMTGYESKRAAAQEKLAQPAREPVGGTREAFEKWAKTFPNYIDITRFENGYSDSDTNYAWIAWQAALAQPALEPVAWMYPDALCDRACLYVCTKAFTQFPECATTPPQPTVQVSPLEFVEMVMDKEHLVGNPIVWAQWPNKEENT